MAFRIRPTTVADEAQLIEFMARMFPGNTSIVHPLMMRWKYWDPREDWPEPRSFVGERDGRFVGHIAIWPVTLRTGTKSERGVHGMDWAADALGVAPILIKYLTNSYDFVYGIGGEEQTRLILPKLGFRPAVEAQTWARPIRPWRQMLTHQSRDWKLAPRFVRNSWWSRIPPRRVLHGWTYEPGAASAAVLADLGVERDPSFFQYLQQCPAATFLTFHIKNEGRVVGFFALLIVGEQARVAGVWLKTPSPESWHIAFQFARDAARQHTNASEIIARCTTEAANIGAKRAGMRLEGQMPVLLFRKDGSQVLPSLPFQLCDSDALFIKGEQAGFLT